MPKRRFMGLPFPVSIGIIVVLLGLGIVSFLGGALGSSFFPNLNLPDWISVAKPQIELPAAGIFHIFGFTVTNTIIASWLSIIVIVGLAYAVTRRIKLVPSRLQSLLEFAIEWMLNFCIDVAGEKNGRRFFPIVTTIFLFVLINAWMNLIPGYGSILITGVEGHEVHLLRGANTDINLSLALALVAFVFVEYHGIRALGFRYFKKFINVGQFFGGFGKLFSGKVRAGMVGLGMGAIDIFVGVLEGMSELVRVVSFTFRLFGNMTGGEILILMMLFLSPWLLAIPFYGLELLVGLVQAIVFAGLTLVFATVAITPHGGEEH